jgi:5-methylcytosine-specific restriction endonuclease McrA
MALDYHASERIALIMSKLNPRARPPIPKHVQVAVFRRDRWLCQCCGRPVIFPAAMKYLARLVRDAAVTDFAPAYYNVNWRRDLAPLLDELGASVDHIEAHSRGGSSLIDNLATICGKCNVRKSARALREHMQRHPRQKIRAKYGEPGLWDGLSSVFMALAQRDEFATPGDKQWLSALTRVPSGIRD